MQLRRAKRILCAFEGYDGYAAGTELERESCLGRAREYMLSVISGERPSNRYEMAAVTRQLLDMDRRRFGYSFNAPLAEWYCSRVELFRHYEGKQFAGKPFVLEGWQCFIFTTVYGWVDSDGDRRFRMAYVEVPRKSGKSPMAAAATLLALGPDEEPGAQVYTAASKERQANIVLKHAKMMAERAPEYLGRYGIKVHASTMSIDNERSVGYGSVLEALTSAGDDGLNVHFAAIDELHQHRNRDLFDSLDNATGARTQSLLWMITTAGTDKTGVCYEQHDYLTKVLDSAMSPKSAPFDDEHYFGVIYTVDQRDLDNREALLTDERLWIKANPNYGVSVSPLDFRAKARKALRSPSTQHSFLTKRVNVWLGSGTPWMDMIQFDRCTNKELKLAQFAGRDCIIALDLASKRDIAALVVTFLDGEDLANGTMSLFGRYYLPEAAVKESRNASYAGWVDQGFLKVTEGNVTDYDTIERDLLELASLVQIADIAYDPAQATQLANHISGHGFPMTEIVQTYNNLSEPMQIAEGLVLDRRFQHDGNPVFWWSVANVVAKMRMDTEQIRPVKERAENKIDPAVAWIISLNRWLSDAPQTSIYDSRGVLTA